MQPIYFSKKINIDLARAIYVVLIAACDAPPEQVNDFVRNFLNWFGNEWRFIGNLGFGGKIHWAKGEIYLSCNKEDETPARLEIMERAHKALNILLNADNSA